MVFTEQGSDVADGTNRDQVQQVMLFDGRSFVSAIERLREFERYTNATEVALAIGTIGAPGINHCICLWARLWWMVVVSDDDIDSQGVRVCYLFHVRAGTIGGDEQRCALTLEIVNCSDIEATVFTQAIGDVIVE